MFTVSLSSGPVLRHLTESFITTTEINLWHFRVYFMYVPDIHVIAIHAFPKIYLDIKMSDFVTNKRKQNYRFYKYTRQLNNKVSNLKHDTCT